MPSQYASLVFLDAIAARGAQCELLQDWQAAMLHAQVRDAARAWSEDQRRQLTADAAEDSARRACDDEAMNLWIEGARRGMESEGLAHYIVAYRALSNMTPPPALFVETTQIEDHAAARAVIDAKIAALEASGAIAEGGVPWAEFVARTSAGIEQIAQAHAAGEATPRVTREQAEAWIRDSVSITELWLADSAD